MEKRDYVIISEGETIERPSNPYEGYQYWNSQTNRLEVYKNGVWKNVYLTPNGEILEGDVFTMDCQENINVLMGGTDITLATYDRTNGTIYIENVTGDVDIVPIPPTPEPPSEEDGGNGDNGEPTEGGGE